MLARLPRSVLVPVLGFLIASKCTYFRQLEIALQGSLSFFYSYFFEGVKELLFQKRFALMVEDRGGCLEEVKNALISSQASFVPEKRGRLTLSLTLL